MRKPTGQSRYYIHWHSTEGRLLKTSTGETVHADAQRIMYSFNPDDYEASRKSIKDTASPTIDATSPTASPTKKRKADSIGNVWTLFIAERTGKIDEKGITDDSKKKTILHFESAFRQLCKWFIEENKQDLKDLDISYFDEHPEVDQNSADALRDMFEAWLKYHGGNTARKYRSAMSSFYTYLHKHRYVRLQLFKHKERGQDSFYINNNWRQPDAKTGWFTKAELQQLIDNLEADYTPEFKEWWDQNKYYALCRYTYMSHQLLTDIYTFAMYTGLRLGEVLHLKFSDVDFHEKLLHVRADKLTGWKPKNWEMRDVPLNSIPYDIVNRLFAEREAYKENHPDTETIPYVFTTHKYTKRIRDIALSAKTTNLCIAIWGEYTQKNFHSFRRSFARMVSKVERNTVVIQRLLGHKSISTTLAYIGITNEDKRTAVDNM
jgi:integrase